MDATEASERFEMPVGEAMFTMRAIRRVKPDPIDDDDLRDILTAATRAPSGGNSQPWHFLVVQDPAQRQRFADLYREAWWAKRADEGIEGPEGIVRPTAQSAMRLSDEIGQAPVVILVCAAAKGAGAMAGVIPATQNLLLAARALGIGGTITTLHAVVDERVHELFDIPEEIQIVYCIPLGYPKGEFGSLERKPLNEVTSIDRWAETPEWAEADD
jgi:nitroreductase